MQKRYCNRCGIELDLQISANEHILYDCWTTAEADGQEVENQEEFDLCKKCHRQFRKFMRGKLEPE